MNPAEKARRRMVHRITLERENSLDRIAIPAEVIELDPTKLEIINDGANATPLGAMKVRLTPTTDIAYIDKIKNITRKNGSTYLSNQAIASIVSIQIKPGYIEVIATQEAYRQHTLAYLELRSNGKVLRSNGKILREVA